MPFSQKHERNFQCLFCSHTFSTQKDANIHTSLMSCSKNQCLHTPQPAKPPELPPPPATVSNTAPASPEGPCRAYYPGAARVVGKANTALDDFNEDTYAKERSTNLYYPWSSREEWQLARFLLGSSMSLAEIDEYLRLELVSFFFKATEYFD